MELEIHIRQNAVFNLTNQQVYYDGANPFALTTIVGTLPAARQWQNYPSFIDITDHISDSHKLKLQFSSQRDDSGNIVTSQNQIKKSVSGTLTFEGLAYQLVKSWLIEDVSAARNSIEVMIIDVGCGEYHNYVIKPTDVNWCQGSICTYDIILKQKDEAYNCIKSTLIADNWQGWFPEDGKPVNKKHPRFSYCNEVRPNATLVIEWYILTSIFSSSFLFLIPLLLTINPILWILQQVQNILNANWGIPGPLNLGDIFDGISTVYIESAGCGREHPAPLIRDYISNVCDKCGVTVNAQTAPLFFSNVMTVETSTGVETGTNEYYNACYFNAPVKRGIRRFKHMSIGGGFQNPASEYWIPDNQPLLTLDMFLDQVLYLFNHEWKVKNNELIIKRKDQISTQPFIYDFREGGADEGKIIEGICFEPTSEKQPASCTGIYIPDGSDSCGNEAGNVNGTGQMNGVVSFTDGNNPNLEGILSKASQFGATKFRFDGTSGDYIYDAIQVVMNGAGFSVLGLPGAIFSTLQEVEERLSEYADFVLLLQSETAMQPKILIWDGERFENARCIITKAAWDGVSSHPMPTVNPAYNVQLKEWKRRHEPHTDVVGKNLTFPASPSGIYRVTDLFGLQIAQQAAHLVNYPMYFEPYYKGTLWHRFHWIDDPNRFPKMGYGWSGKIRLCCEELQKIGCFNDASGIVLDEKVLIPFGYFEEGTIREITVSYDPSDANGRYIELRGKL